jgi:5-methylcytosine-specific restriction endonuclease McrA
MTHRWTIPLSLRRSLLAEGCAFCIRPAGVIDHIVPLADGGVDNPSNLQGLCWDCHQDKSYVERWRRRRIRTLILFTPN